MKAGYLFNAISVLFAFLIISCTSSSIILQENREKSEIIIFAERTGKLVAVANPLVNQEDFSLGTLTKSSYRYYLTKRGSNRKELIDMNFLKFIFIVDPACKTKIKYKSGNNTSNLELIIKDANGSKLYTGSPIRTEVKLTDDSKIIGELTQIDVKTGNLHIKTKLQDFNIPYNTIKGIKMSIEEVKLILIDGTERKGGLLKDDGNIIVLRTILGEETYDRRKVYKINYQ